MTEDDSEAPLTETYQVNCLYVTGASIESTRHVMRLVAWVSLPDLGGETAERRIVVRFAMPIRAAQNLLEDMKEMLATKR